MRIEMLTQIRNGGSAKASESSSIDPTISAGKIERPPETLKTILLCTTRKVSYLIDDPLRQDRQFTIRKSTTHDDHHFSSFT